MVVRSALAAACVIGLASLPVPARGQLASPARPAATRIAIDDLYSYDGFTTFNGNELAAMDWVPEGGPWIDAAHYLWPDRTRDSSGWLRVDAAIGRTQTLVNASGVESALVKAGMARDDVARVIRRRPGAFNARRDAVLLSSGHALYLYDISRSSAVKLADSPRSKSEQTFSPDGRTIAFVQDNNLHVVDIASLADRSLTTNGDSRIFNGVLDWVYSEELYGRGNHRGYWWSPDSSQMAMLQLDDRQVPTYTLVDDITNHPTIDTWPYPKAGDPNPVPSLVVFDLKSGARRDIDLAKYAAENGFLIVNVGWTPDGRRIAYQVQNRQQTWLDFNTADPATGVTTTLFRETSKAWVERQSDASADPIWLKDGTFLWLSERSGWRHVYRYGLDGALINQVTNGNWEVRDAHGVDQAAGWLYFSGTEHGVLDLNIYRVKVDGSSRQQLSSTPGTHVPFFNPTHTLYLEKRSDVTTPPQVRLYATAASAAGATLSRVVDDNPTTAAREYGLSRPEFLQVKTRDGFIMEAMMIKPPDFDASRRYPVYQFVYGGPHAQQVLNAWPADWREYAYHQLLASHGIIIWVCDNRTASGKGAAATWGLYKNFGELELADIEDGLGWLKQQPYVDASHIGISGASYGGFMTLYALTHSRSFAMGIAESPVSDWRNYDSIYTERYLGLPADNPDGYRRSSPRYSAADLTGELLLIHGSLDDNVHPQNSAQFAYELQKARKSFQMMLYPRLDHGVDSLDRGPHLRRLILDFTLKNLGVER